MMACHQGCAKPLSELRLEYCSFDPQEQNPSETSIEIYVFSSKKMHLEMSSGNWRPLYHGINVLNDAGILFGMGWAHIQNDPDATLA